MSLSSTTADRAPLRWIVAFAAAAWLVTHAAFALAPELFRAWDRRATDRFFVLRSGMECKNYPCRGRVVHVDVTYSGLRQMANRQLTRADHARVIDSLSAAGAAAQVFDMVFAAPGDAADNTALVQAASASGRAYFAVAFHLEPPDAAASSDGAVEDEPHVEAAAWDVTIEGDARDLPEGFAPLAPYADLAAVSRLGFINLSADGDGIFRRTPLLMRYKGRIFPSLGLRIACDALGVAPRDVVLTPGRAIRLRNAKRPGSADARDIVIPIDDSGHYRIDFAGPWEAFRHVSYREVWRATRDPLAFEEMKDAFAGRIALVADTSTGSGDGGPVPTDPRFQLPGVHATVIQNILQESFVREARAAEGLAIELVLLAAVTLFAWRLGSRGIAAATALLGAAYIGMAVGTFLYLRVILPVVGPSLLLASAAFVTIVYRFINEEKARLALRQSFAAYFPPSVVDRIVKNPGLVTESGQRKELSILFSDIVGFAGLCETMTPEELRRFLNRHFAAMVDIAFEYGGTVDKFIGDGLMAFFGDPDDQPDHAARAVRAAIAMQLRVRELDGYKLRIGINTGIVIVGNMGSPRRLSYTVLGEPVNLAQRLESNAPHGGILIANRTQELIAGAIRTIPCGAIPIKGMAQKVSVHEVPVDTPAGRRPQQPQT